MALDGLLFLAHRRDIFDPSFVRMLEGLKAPPSVLPSGHLAEALGSARNAQPESARGQPPETNGTSDNA